MTAGTDNTKAVTSKTLHDAGLSAPTGATAAPIDAGKLVRLDALGKVDTRFLSVSGFNLKGALDQTTTAPAAPVKGDFYYSNKTGTPHASFGLGTGVINSGDAVFYDGTAWRVIANELDLNAYVSLAKGGNMELAARLAWKPATPATPEVFIDLNGGILDNALVDCGTF